MTVEVSLEQWGWTPPGGQEFSLSQPWLQIGTVGGSRAEVPTLRGSDYEVPFRSGLRHRPKFPNARTISLVMWTAGIDQNSGDPAADQTLAWNDNWQAIRQSFWTRDALGSAQGVLTRRWLLSSGGPGIVTASALAEVAGPMTPSMTGRTRADFTVDLLLSDPYFISPSQQSVTCQANGNVTMTGLGEGIVGENWPSVLNSFTVTFSGPLTTPTLTNSTSGTSLTVLGTILAGSQVTVDVLGYTAFNELGASVLRKVKHGGSRLWFALFPRDNAVSVSTLDGTDTGSVTASWHDLFL